ncbi:MarR family transcriptional regulator [Tsukamurella sp. 8F]|uniref:MarR family winged helix-turn-helix transcriptional regulator n=1 Tax=unclassified Tsukamurella TaxID=2633480 RepID=UPI0023BA0972|nr:MULTISPECIES: MarR family transcriptional regulator [unclassified Tsukamurella]MDF0530099.1 MarR family transcriptional regulator [Tsukamurella sp. 8J]MDF0586417.1 MarR family transcriptional regulator [Tsukamurella sp. 8F]
MSSPEERSDPIALARANWENAGWGGDIAVGMEAVTSVMRAHQIMLGRIEHVLKPFRLTFARFELLRLLAFSRRGALPISRASARLQVHVSSVTHAIDRLEDAGLVERLPHPTDGRTTLVALTADGRHVVEEATLAVNDVFAEFGSELGSTGGGALVDSLRVLRRANGDF